ncbi:predicted protein [Pyrenophora tritici-repentis Pt-1C-BFP]|uniref:Uncharacterized protein n=1 Tax=Pyrenophora tritici-repentis (strain Pt-1C-BFP) TaxID=426418 RepID=B2W059_PYRTR|nr:uncharacterized protein PTRG_03049 [Pyrenophora tritici-repentis Pt-1C-BFP]EDU45572.1 predicted protein [Pyrenophora tritici-repentis Pt-1C-BFP]
MSTWHILQCKPPGFVGGSFHWAAGGPLDVNTWKMRNSRGVGGASGLESWEDFSPEAQEGRTMDKT